MGFVLLVCIPNLLPQSGTVLRKTYRFLVPKARKRVVEELSNLILGFLTMAS